MINKIPSSVKRDLYLDRIIPFVDKNIIKVFTGQRRVGKSYMLFQIMQIIRDRAANAHIIYINKEDMRFDNIKTAVDLNEYVTENRAEYGKSYLFIDEIQEIEDFEKALRSLLLDPDIDIYCTGSNAQLLSSDIAGHLSGRSIEIPIYSLTYSEFLVFHNLEANSESLEQYMKYGGLPYLKHLPMNDTIIFEYLKNIYSTILFRDVVNRYSVRNTSFLEQLVYFLASNTGSLFSSKKISDFLISQQVNISPNQVQLYLQHLSNAYLIHQVKRYDVEGKRLFEFGEKYYFENMGIRNALWGYRLQDRGKIMENVVYNHLVANGYKTTIGIIGDNEIDFVAEKDGEKMYVQVALSLTEEKTIEREFGNLKKINDNYPKMVVTMDPFSGNTEEGIVTLSLMQFLMKTI